MPGDAFDVTAFGIYSKNLLLIRGWGISSLAVNIGAGGSYTPDLNQAVEHNITCAGAITINAPVEFAGPLAGFVHLLILHIKNPTGGPIVSTLNAKYHLPTTFNANIGAGTGDILTFHHDDVADVWYAVAAQTVSL